MAIQLTIPVLTDAPIVLDGVTKVPTPAVMISMDGANESHASPYPLDAWYVTEGGSPTAGAVTAIMEYRVSYL